MFFFVDSLVLPKEVLDGRLGGPGLVLMDPPYEPYNEYLTWNLNTIHMLLGLGSGSLLGSLGFSEDHKFKSEACS